VDAFKDRSCVSKMALLTDATSPVPGFEHQYDDFIEEFVKEGLRLTTTVEALS
jgi:hypothetical protein